MNWRKITYWIVTGLLSALMLYTAAMYFVKYQTLAEVFARLGYPAYIIRPLAVAKILGIIAILTKRSRFLKKLAYAGFFYDFLLAISAHLNAGDTLLLLPSLVCLILLIVSYWLDKQLYEVSSEQ